MAQRSNPLGWFPGRISNRKPPRKRKSALVSDPGGPPRSRPGLKSRVVPRYIGQWLAEGTLPRQLAPHTSIEQVQCPHTGHSAFHLRRLWKVWRKNTRSSRLSVVTAWDFVHPLTPVDHRRLSRWILISCLSRDRLSIQFLSTKPID